MTSTGKERIVTVAATQMCSGSPDENLKKAESLLRIAASRGAQIVLLQELFQQNYFPIHAIEQNFDLATELETNRLIHGMCRLAKEFHIVLPISFFEKFKNSYYNSVAIIDADGTIVGVSRSVHVTNSRGYYEGYYFSSALEAFPVFKTKFGTIGILTSCDQWYPEAARSLVLQGAEIIFCPTALGSFPLDAENDAKDHWERVLQGHAAMNMVPIVASNRAGVEHGKGTEITFFGSSFIAGATGKVLKVADRESEGVIVEALNLDRLKMRRGAFGLLRDRMPSAYSKISTRDGIQQC